jgi:hypothetical protein
LVRIQLAGSDVIEEPQRELLEAQRLNPVSRHVDRIREHPVVRRHDIDDVASDLVAGNRSAADLDP